MKTKDKVRTAGVGWALGNEGEVRGFGGQGLLGIAYIQNEFWGNGISIGWCK